MISIINGNFTRIKKSKVFYLGFLAIVLIAIYMTWNTHKSSLDICEQAKSLEGADISRDVQFYNMSIFYYFAGVVVAAVMIVVPFIIGADSSYGTLRNMIASGKSRTSIYIANIITAISIAIIYLLAWIIPMWVVGVKVFELNVVNTWDNIINESLVGMLIVMTFTIVYASLTMIFKNYKFTIILCMSISALLAISAYFLKNQFDSAEFLKKEADNGESIDKNNEEITKVNIELAKKKIASKLLDNTQKQSQEDFIKEIQEEAKKEKEQKQENSKQEYGDSIVRRNDIANKKKKWITFYQINPVCQGIEFKNLRKDSYEYTIDGKRHDRIEKEEKEKKENEEFLHITPESMADEDARIYVYYVFERNNIDTDEENEKVHEEEEKARKVFLEKEKKLFEDASYKKLVEKRIECENNNNKMELETPYDRFNLDLAVITDISCIIIFLLHNQF